MSIYTVWLYFFSAEKSHIILDRKLSDSSDRWRNRMWGKHTDSTSEYIFICFCNTFSLFGCSGPSLMHTGFLLQQVGLLSSYGARAFIAMVSSFYEHRLYSTWAQ